MRLYCGIDLHSSNSYFAVLDEEFRLVSVVESPTPSRRS